MAVKEMSSDVKLKKMNNKRLTVKSSAGEVEIIAYCH